jgi:cyclophilin family peptidyl-prolyl cis-trans isomerase
MSAKDESSRRKRSRPVTKTSVKTKIKRNKPAMFLSIFIVLMLVFSGLYIALSSLGVDKEIGEDIKNSVAVINTTAGVIKVELFEDKVPITARNFKNLAEDGFYDGLVFHRVISGFMIQGGGFGADGTQYNSDQITFETNPDVLHVDGSISMASTDAGAGGTNQFFICDGPQHFLDNDYAAFGVVIEGIDVVRSIANVGTTTKYDYHQNWPIDDIFINSITIETQ